MIRSTPQLLNDWKYIKKLNLNQLCEDDQLSVIEKYNFLIDHIENPSERCQFASIKSNIWNIRFIKNPSIKAQLYVAKFHPKSLCFINNISFKVCQYTLYRDIYNFNYINKECDCYQEVKELYEFLTK